MSQTHHTTKAEVKQWDHFSPMGSPVEPVCTEPQLCSAQSETRPPGHPAVWSQQSDRRRLHGAI